MKNTSIFISLLFLLGLSSSIYGQKKVLGYPKAYVTPSDPYLAGNQSSFESESVQKSKVKKRAWWVVVDREGVDVHSDPKSNSDVKMTLGFGETYYVTEIKKDGWYHLVDALVDKTKITKLYKKIGWVHKDNLLLWNESLVNPRTQIRLKALMLNKLGDFESVPCDRKEIVKVYKSPYGSELKEKINIYRFYFVYKKEKGRFLLGSIPGLSQFSKEDLLGWVDKTRLEEWNTRIALEPNFTEAGYNERKQNKNFEIKGFKDQWAVEEYVTTGAASTSGIVWKRDPVSTAKENLSKVDEKRFRGDFMRFPLISDGDKSKGKVLPYFRSAVCDEVQVKIKCKDGKIVEVANISMKKHGDGVKYLEKYQEAASNFNVFFVVEQSSDLNPYQEELISLSKKITENIRATNSKAKVKMGALCYKDITESDNLDNLISYSELSSDQYTLERFIRNTTFANPNSNFSYPIQNYGILKALQVANFPENHTNILIVLGNKGDFTYDRALRVKYRKSKAIVNVNTLTDEINKGNVNVMGIQCKSSHQQSFKEFPQNIRRSILEAAKKNYNSKFTSAKAKKVLASAGINLQSPNMDDPDDSQEILIRLKNGTIRGEIFRNLELDNAIPKTSLSELVVELTRGIVKESIQLYSDLEKAKSGSFSYTEGEGFAPQIPEILIGMFDETDLELSWLKEKFELYNETYFARKPKGANSPSFSYVLFWPDDDLRDYKRILEKASTDLSDSNVSTQRKALKNAYCMLLEEFTGGGSDKSCEDYTVDEIFQTVQGVEGEGVEFNFNSTKISCITDSKCTSDQEIQEMVKRFIDSRKKIKALTTGEDDSFVFKRGGDQFFWVKIEDLY